MKGSPETRTHAHTRNISGVVYGLPFGTKTDGQTETQRDTDRTRERASERASERERERERGRERERFCRHEFELTEPVSNGIKTERARDRQTDGLRQTDSEREKFGRMHLS